MKKYNTLITILTCALIFSTCLSQIIPDVREPIKVNLPHITSTNTSRQITFKFRLEETLKAPFNGHVFAATFPANVISQVENSDNCTLFLGDREITVQKVIVPSESNTLFCKINSPEVSFLNGSEESFILNFSLANGILVNFTQNVALSVRTSEEPYGVILAQKPFFANFGVYGNYAVNNPLLKASVVTVRPKVIPTGCASPCTLLYPNSDFEFVVRLEATGYIPTNTDALITVEFTETENTVEKAANLQFTSESFSATSSAVIEGPLRSKGSLGYAAFNNANEALITEVGENLIKGRKFTIVLSGLRTKMPAESSIGDRAIIRVYWANTMSLISYDSIKLDFPVSPLSIKFTPNSTSTVTWDGISHPDFVDIYENGSWPLRFVFTVPAVANGGFFRIEHESTEYTIFNFIPSTCDFSDEINGQVLINNEFGKRPVCYSSRNALNTDFNGENKFDNGFFFRVPPSTTEQTLSVTIWGVALKCSENSLENSQFFNVLNSSFASKNIKRLTFSYSLYTEIDQTNSGNFFSNTNKLAELKGVRMYGSCFANISNHSRSELNPLDIYEDSNTIALTNDVVLYNEVYDWNLTAPSTTNGSINFISSTNIKYLFSSDNTKVAQGGIEFGVNTQAFEFPIPTYRSFKDPGNNTANDRYSLYNGYLSLTLSSTFITAVPQVDENNKNCRLRWYSSSQSDIIDSTSNRNVVALSGLDSRTIESSRSNLWQTGGYSTDITKYIAPIVIATNDLNPDPSNTEDKRSSFAKDPKTVQNFGFYTDCYQFRDTANSNVRSLYNYIDFTYKWHRLPLQATNYIVTRVARFVKLLQNSQVIQRRPAITTDTGLDAIPTFYFVATDSQSNNEMCILKVNIKSLDSTKYNTIIITLNNLRLLDIDAYNTSTEYPVLQVNTNKVVVASNVVYPYTINTFGDESYGMLNYASNADSSKYKRVSAVSNKIQSHDNGKYYQTFFGSTITLTSDAFESFLSASNYIDVIIPVICPSTIDVEADEVNFRSHIFEAVSITLANFNNKMNNRLTTAPVVQSFRGTDSSSDLVTEKIISSSSSYVVKSPRSLELNFANFLNTTVDSTTTVSNVGYLYLKAPSTTNCDSLTLLTSTDTSTNNNSNNSNLISFKHSQTDLTITNSASYTSSYNNFYYMGKSYNNIFVQIFNNKLTINTAGNTNSSNEIYFNGVNRPSINEYSRDYYSTMKVHCVNSLTYISTSDPSLGRLKDNTIVSAEDPKLTITAEPFDSIFDDDIAASYYFKTSIPAFISPEGRLSINSSSIQSYSICGYDYDDTKFAQNCDVSSNGGNVICNLGNISDLNNSSPRQVNICCYNIKNKDLTKLTILDSSNYADSTVYQVRHSMTGLFEYSIAQGTKIASVTPGIVDITFSQVNQENGLGVVFIKINLGRPAKLNQRIRITGHLSKLYIDDTLPNCQFTYSNASPSEYAGLVFGAKYNSGDYLADKCFVSSDRSVNHTIDLYNKKSILKCGIVLSNTVIIRLAPVFVINLNKTSFNTYTIASSINDFATANYITAPPKSVNKDVFPNVNFIENQFILPDQTSTTNINLSDPNLINNRLCNVKDIYPLMIGASAEYDFEFDLTNFPISNNEVVSGVNKVANEFTIYFSPEKFERNENILCFYENQVLLPCSWEENGFLNIKFENSLAVNNSSSKYVVRIVGITNPLLFHGTSTVASRNGKFYCSVNFFNNEKDTRENLIVGRGSINFSTYDSVVKGNFIYLNNNVIGSSNTVPRETSTIKLRFSLDTTLSINNAVQEFKASDTTRTPVFFVEFPNQFRLGYQRYSLATTITAQIFVTNVDEVISQDSTDRVYKDKVEVPLNELSLRGNLLRIPIKANSLAFDEKTAWIEISLYNVPTPWNSVNTSAINVSLIDDEKTATKVFKSYSNLNGSSYSRVSPNTFEWYKGVTYEFKNNKAAVNVFNVESPKSVNSVKIKQGRYSKIRVKVDGELAYAKSKMSLNFDSMLNNYNKTAIRMLEDDVEINTGLLRENDFHLGAKCNGIPGNYYAHFKLSNTTGFYNLSPVKVQVLEIHRNVEELFTSLLPFIGNTASFNIPPGGFLRFFVWSNTMAYEDVGLHFTAVSDLNNTSSFVQKSDRSRDLIKKHETMTFFDYIIGNTTTNQALNLVSDNSCFGFSQNSAKRLDFVVTGYVISLDDYDFASAFEYSYPNITNAYNAISIDFKARDQCSVYCQLTCADLDFRSNDEIERYATFSLQESALEQYYSNFFTANSTVPIVFDNLYRGQQYKLKCLVKNNKNIPQVKEAEFTQMKINLASYQSIDKSVFPNNYVFTNLTDLVTEDIGVKKYLKFTFSEAQDYAYLIQLVNGVQRLLNGKIEDIGRIIAKDSLGNTALGYELEKRIECSDLRELLPVVNDTDSDVNPNNTNTNNSTSETTDQGVEVETTTNRVANNNDRRFLQTVTDTTTTSTKLPQNWILYLQQNPQDERKGNIEEALRDILIPIRNPKQLDEFVVAYTSSRLRGNYTFEVVEPEIVNKEDIKIEGFNYLKSSLTFNASSTIPVVCDWKLNNQGVNQTNATLTEEEILDCPAPDANALFIKCGRFRLDGNTNNYNLRIGNLSPSYYSVDAICAYDLPETVRSQLTLGTVNVASKSIVDEIVSIIPCISVFDINCTASYLSSALLALFGMMLLF